MSKDADKLPLEETDLNVAGSLITVRLVDKSQGKLKNGNPCPKYITKVVTDGDIKGQTVNYGIVNKEAMESLRSNGWKSKKTQEIFFNVPEPVGESELGENGIKWLNQVW